MGEIGWDLSAVQSTDLLLGVDGLKARSAKAGIPLVCANLLDARGEAPFEAGHIFEIGDKRLAVLAVVEPDEQNARKRIDKSLRFGDPQEAIEKGVAGLRGRCDAIVLLFGGRRDTALKRCKSIEGIDLIFYGMASGSQRVPAETDLGTPIYSAASRGKDFGEITLTFLDGGGVKCGPFTVHELDKTVPDDPVIHDRVAAFRAEADERKSRTRQIRDAVSDASEKLVRDNFVGIERCAFCHQDIVNRYEEGPHARSFESLAGAFEDNNPACVSCHVTGWKLPGGFGQASSEKRNLEQVQCEACHGPGTAHRRDGGMLVAARESCLRCHNAEIPGDCGTPPIFDYGGFWSRIAH